MIKKLRIKLVAVAMLSLFLVLSVVMVTVNVLNYRDVLTDADRLLSILADNDGHFPLDGQTGGHIAPGLNEGAPEKPQRPGLSPETPYETRYFSVLLKQDGTVVSVDTGRIAAVDTQTAVEYASDVWDGTNGSGFLYNYRYRVCAAEEGNRVIFLDCSQGISTFRTFLVTSLAVSALGLLAVFVLLVFLSARIVKPVSDSYEKQKRFVTDAGHEIKTPLTVIEADAELLSMDLGRNEWLDDIRTQTKRLADLTNDLIFLSRMEESPEKMQKIDLPFSDLVEEISHSFQALAKTQGKRLELCAQPLVTVCGNENALRQLVSVLLDNAVKYSEPESCISVRLDRVGHSVRLCVENDARPLSKEQLRNLFDRFYRTDASRSSRTGGYGIGLSIAKAVAETHRGKISASFENGRLAVSVVLPAPRK